MPTETATQQEPTDSPVSHDLSTLPADKVIETIEQFREALAAAKRAAAAYYDTDVLAMSDSEYDELVESIAAAQVEHPDWDDDGVLTQVAAGASAGGSLKHPQPMLSLDKTTEPSAMAAFVTAMPGRCVVEVKLDGNAVRGSYSNGRLVTLATRGDGVSGEPLDITMDIAGLPKTIDLPGDVHVTGEVYMTETGFERTCANRVASGKEAFANARNATAGVLRRQERTFEAYLSFAAYHAFGTPELDNIDSYPERMAAVAKSGVQTVQSLQDSLDLTTTVTSTAVDVTAQITAMEAARPGLPLDIDGAVVKVASYTQRETIGVATRHPKWALAFKFAPLETSSYLSTIEVGVGRTGNLTLTGVLDPPALLDGVMVERATLHNPKFVADNGLGIGSKCLITRQGDVIPRIVASLDSQPEGITAWTPPTTCPLCDEPWDKSSVLWRCHTYSCGLANRIAYAASRDVLDIESLGGEVALALVEAGKIVTLADLFDLTVQSVAATPIGLTSTGKPRLIGATTARKIVAGIDAGKRQPLNRVVCSLGISKMGRTMSRRLATHFGSLAAMRSADAAAFMEVEGVASEKAAAYVAGFAQMADDIDRMVAAGVTTEAEKAASAARGTLPLAGMKVVVTGSMAGTALSALNRNQMSELIERAGGQASGSVSASTSLLVCSEPGSSKHTKAVSFNVPIVQPDEFAVTVAAFL